MKKITLISVILFLFYFESFSQQQEDEPFFYKVEGLVYFYEYDITNKAKTQNQKIPKEGLKFRVVAQEFDSSNNSEYYIVRFLKIISDNIGSSGQTKSLKGNSTFINSDDNDKYYWIDKNRFDRQIEDSFVTLSYKTPNSQLTYGASVSLPFKYRPKTSERNIKITPDISLGGYLGLRNRLSPTKPYYISFPVATFGLTTLTINDSNNPSDQGKGDGLVLGVTASTGLILQLDDFQVGFMFGVDRSAGELGKDWVYNDKAWYSLSIGYTFIGRKSAKQKK